MRLAPLVAALALSCNPYDPDLGDAPFLCGTEEPRCPAGYVAVAVSAVRCECQRATVAPDAGAQYECATDPQEDNDTVAAATATDLGVERPQVNYPLAAICPAADEDHFQLAIARAGTLIRIDTTFDLGRAPPDVSVLNASGQTLQSMTESPQAGFLVTTHTATQTGSFYVKLAASQEVNYQLRIMIIPPP